MISKKQREHLGGLLEHAHAALSDGRGKLDREWVSEGIMFLREADEWLQSAINYLAAQK